jgi:hypothetical protein
LYCSQITHLDADLLFEILGLVEKIKDRPFSLKQYAAFISGFFDNIGLFGIFDGRNLVAYLQCEPPHPLNPEKAFVNVAVNTGAPKEKGKELLRMAERWMKEKGATKWLLYTRRNPAVFKRAWQLEPEEHYVLARRIRL